MQYSSATLNKISSSYSTANLGNPLASAKDYASSTPLKSLGNASLSQWLSDATNYYNSVMSGETPKPSPQEWGQFVQWLQWAKQESFGGGWDPTAAQGGNGEAGYAAQVNEFGGELSADGNSWNYDVVDTNLGFTGAETRNNSFATNNTLNLEQPSAKVTCEETMDHGVAVLKVVVTTSKGTAVYLYDNFKDAEFKLRINAANVDQVIGEEGFAGKIEVAKFDPKAKSEELNAENFSVAGEKQDDGSYLYESAGSVEYNSSPLGKDAQGNPVTRNSEVFGHLNLNLAPSDVVTVQAGNTKDKTGNTITITHKDGSKDVILTHQNGKDAYQININGLTQQISWNGTQDATGKGVPETFQDSFSVNGTSGSEESEAPVDAQAILDNLFKEIGITSETKFVNALQDAGFSDLKTMDDVREAITQRKFPPKPSDKETFMKFVNFLGVIDSDLYEEHQAWATAAKGTDAATGKKTSNAYMSRLTELLEIAYPDKVIHPKPYNSEHFFSGYFSMGASSYEIGIYANGSLGVL